MPSDRGRQFNWFHRYWHDWPDVEQTVYEVAVAHARYLGYEVYGAGGMMPPPGDLRDVGPVVHVRVTVFRRNARHLTQTLAVDVERRAGKFHVKSATVTNLDSTTPGA
jgi:hypothetical protein